ncbi:uncharacterized protein LOC131059848 [Cryptomeria japonica]|uniref:uncharacterized protein LOC131059848 n=1 Tax=Cryptomeria japonica TaxID=3369 RepID=UPI0027DA11DA|nr:uncharacterized protein LOC131059848 [Cryptomeria japonica]XP_057848878.2 uncharacterized protein LOC131059848 [Cryptomeria japonica]
MASNSAFDSDSTSGSHLVGNRPFGSHDPTWKYGMVGSVERPTEQVAIAPNLPRECDVDMQGIMGSSYRPHLCSPSSSSRLSRAREAQSSLEASEWSKEVYKKADEAIAKFFIYCNLPFSATRSPYWEDFVTAVTSAGEGFKAPSSRDLSGRMLQDAVEDAKQAVEDQKKQWQKFGCTILLDWWINGRNHTLLNFLVGSNDELVFLKSIDASSIIHNAENLSLVLEEVVLELGVQNVVQVVTKNAAAYAVAGRLLQERHPTLFWTPCVGHCLDLLLEDIGKIDWVRPIVEEASDIKKYIYNHLWVFNSMKDYTKGLVRSGASRSVTNFLTVQSISSLLTPLKQMFVSQAWLESPYSKNVDAERVARIVFDDVFANRAIEILKVTEPLVRLLCLVDMEKNSMGYIYEAMRRAKEAIQNYFKEDANRFAPIWEIIDQRWNNQLPQPFHAAGVLPQPQVFLL